MRRALLLLLAAGCAGSSAAVDAGLNDARPGVDARPRCVVQITVSPSDPVAPATLTATASQSDAIGFVNMTWRVTGPIGDVDVTVLDGNGLRVAFMAPEPGPYLIGGTATAGGMACEVVQVTTNVRRLDANSVEIRLSYLPLPAQEAPPQADPQSLTLRGGADFALPAPRVLERGTRVSGQVIGPGGGLAAYLRLQGDGTAELYADGNGNYAGVVPSRNHDVLIIPYAPGVPAQLYLNAPPSRLVTGFMLDAGDPVGGRVISASGAPVAAARVAVASGDLPPVVATTDEDGNFSARARTSAGPLVLRVVPPAPAPRVELYGAQGLLVAPGSSVEVRLAEHALVPLSLVVRTSAGQALAGARVTFVTSAFEGGTFTTGGGPPVIGVSGFRHTALAGDGGALPDLLLPAGALTALVVPPPGSTDVMGVSTLEISDPLPAGVAAAAPVTALVTVRLASGATVAGARAVAVARGVRGVGAGLASSGVTAANGDLTLARIVPGMPYDVTVDPPEGRRLGRGRGGFTGGAPGAVSVTVPPAIELSGRVVFASGTGQAGVRVEARYPGEDAILAETITAAGGTFSLWLPDPGLKEVVLTR